MAEASRRATRPAGRGGLPNALFVVAGIEAPPPELAGLAGTVTVAFPWGSLLRGVIGVDQTAMAGLRALVRPDGQIEALVSIAARDGLGELASALDDLCRLESAWATLGIAIEELRPVRPDEIVAGGSTWAKRLRAGSSDRPKVTRLVLRRLP
jgi:16S rRNA (adenine(1408)-N(1))-methyltransferase